MLAALVSQSRKQRGYFTLNQLLDAGFSRTSIRRMVGSEIAEDAPRVYRSSTTRPSWKDRTYAVTLATGGFACRRSALALYGLGRPPAVPEILVLRSQRNLPPGLCSSAVFGLSDRALTDGNIPTVRAAWLAIEMAASMDLDHVATLLSKLIARNLVDAVALRRRAHELTNPMRPGAARVLRALDTLHPELARTVNEWEALTVAASARHGVPMTHVQHRVVIDGRTYYLDTANPSLRVGIEFAGWDPHGRRPAFDDDHERANDLRGQRWLVFVATARILNSPARAQRFFGRVLEAMSLRDAGARP
jgi:hypothetical protein